MKKIILAFFYIVLIFIITLILANKLTTGNNDSILAVNGIYTIDQYNHEQPMALNGEWEFYFNRLYNPDDFKNNVIEKEPNYVVVPNDWNHYDLPNQSITRKGVATYRLFINIPNEEANKIKTIYMPSVSSAYNLWINGEKKSSNGIVGTSKNAMKPETTPKTIEFLPTSESVELIIQASNYHQRKSGLWDTILLGDPDVIHTYQVKKIIYRAIIVSSLLIMGLYHFSLFALRKNELSFLFFGILCISIAIRGIILEEGLASYLLSFLNWEIVMKLEYLGVTLGVLSLILYSYSQFPLEMKQSFRNALVIVMAIYSIFIILTPAIVYTMTVVALELITLLILLYLVYVYTIALIRKRTGSLLNMIAIIILIYVATNDVLFYNDLVSTTEMTSIGLTFFLLTQSFNLSKNYAKAFGKIEKLSKDLKVFNESLEKEVTERTAELKISNEQLQAATEARRRLLSNISHELGTPLTSIQGYTKGMVDGVIPSEKKYLQLVYDKIEYMSKIFNDLHSLTEMETRQIEFHQKEIDIQHYFQNLYRKYQLETEKNNIMFTYKNELDPKKSYYVFIDPHRIEQVIMNFLTNAQKFIEENGQITLKLTLADCNNVMIQCIDNGCGIIQQDIDYVFERFYKSSSKENTRKGAGLGLAISKEIIEFHNGKIGVKSNVGEGSCFFFVLPLLTRN